MEMHDMSTVQKLMSSPTGVLTQPASQKLLAAQLFTPNFEAVAVPTVLSDTSNRPGRPKGIFESRLGPSLKLHERAEQDRPQEHVSPGFLVTHLGVGRWRKQPRKDIQLWSYHGDQQPTEAEYDHFCRACQENTMQRHGRAGLCSADQQARRQILNTASERGRQDNFRRPPSLPSSPHSRFLTCLSAG